MVIRLFCRNLVELYERKSRNPVPGLRPFISINRNVSLSKMQMRSTAEYHEEL